MPSGSASGSARSIVLCAWAISNGAVTWISGRGNAQQKRHICAFYHCAHCSPCTRCFEGDTKVDPSHFVCHLLHLAQHSLLLSQPRTALSVLASLHNPWYHLCTIPGIISAHTPRYRVVTTLAIVSSHRCPVPTCATFEAWLVAVGQLDKNKSLASICAGGFGALCVCPGYRAVNDLFTGRWWWGERVKQRSHCSPTPAIDCMQ